MATIQHSLDGAGKEANHKDVRQETPDLESSKGSTSNDELTRLPAFGGELQPGLHAPLRKFANPAPLGLAAFALTTFVLSLINVGTRGVTKPDIIISLAYGYGGLLQFISGMWYDQSILRVTKPEH